jgi:hypothetical protein
VDCFQNAREVLIDVVIPKPQNTKAAVHQSLISFRVSRLVGVEVVLAAVDFDHKPMLQTYEIDNVTLARSLPTKMKSECTPATQVIPDFHLLRRQCFP